MKYANNIERPKYQDPIHLKGAGMLDTINLIRKVSSRDRGQIAKLSQKLKADNVETTAFNIWLWVKENIPYKPDKKGVEQVRTPARVIEDAKNGIGSDCDCYTTFISAILKNLDIEHYYKVVAWDNIGEFGHIYPVAVDTNKNEYAIDCIPEVKQFNRELPFIDFKTFNPMDLQELNGAVSLANEQMDLQDLKEEMTASLDGYNDDDDDYLSTPEVYQSLFGKLMVVDTEDEADFVLDGITFVDNVLAKQIKDARDALRKELRNPTAISKIQDTKKELDIINDVIAFWNSPKRQQVLKSAIVDSDVYRQFYVELSNGTQTTLQGSENSVDLYLKYILDEDIEKYESLDGWFKNALKKVGGAFKKVGRAIGKGVKKVFKAIHRYNPATLLMRGTLMGILKAGGGVLFLSAYAPSKYKNNAKVKVKAKRSNLIIDKIVKLIAMKRHNFDKYARQGINRRFGSVEKAFAKVARGQLKGSDELYGTEELHGELGIWGAVAGIVVKLWGFIKKLFKKKPKDPQLTASDFDVRAGAVSPSSTGTATDFSNTPNYSSYNTKAMTNTPAGAIVDPNQAKPTTKQKVMKFLKVHKTKIIITVISIILLIIGYVWWKKSKKKPRRRKRRRRSLNGARRTTRRRSPARRSTTRRKTSTRRRKSKQVKGAKVIVTRSTVRVRDNGARLRKMHRIAKGLRKKYPNTKYSTLLKRAASKM